MATYPYCTIPIKGAASFLSGRWGSETNPDLAFASSSDDDQLPCRRVLKKFPRSQHRPSLITSTRLANPILSKPVNHWNFRKADWKQYSRITDKLSSHLPSPNTPKVDEANQEFCRVMFFAAKATISRGRRRNYTPCWDEECESLYKDFTFAPNGPESRRIATTLLQKLDEEKRRRWNEAVQFIGFTHSSRRAWNIIDNLTGHSRHPPRQCPTSANAIASQLIRKGKYKTTDRETTRLEREETSEL